MRRAIASAEVADEQRGLDPTVNALQERVAELLGHEAALFLPSGTMCNQIAVRLQTRPGDEVILERFAHPIIAESGGPAAHSGVMMQPIDGAGGMFTGAQVEASLRTPGNRYEPRSRLVCVEQTTNYGGGRVWPLEQIRDVLEVAGRNGLATHLDGARLMNAVVATGVPARDWAGLFDTAWLDFTKGLGAPVGAVLAGSRDLVDEAWRYKQMWGGAMRQAGIVAAAGVYALEHNIERLADDHARARRLAEGLHEAGVPVDLEQVETNFVQVELRPLGLEPGEALERLWQQDVGLSMTAHPTKLRAVTHLDIGDEEIERAVESIPRALGALARA
jgi:threonine aldolase